MKILVIHSRFPEPDTNAGDMRLVEMLGILRATEQQVVFMSTGRAAERYQMDLERQGIECIYDKDRRFLNWDTMEAFARARCFDCAILLTYKVFNAYEYPLRKAGRRTALILDTVDLHFMRARREAELLGGDERYAEADRIDKEEWAAIGGADAVWVVTPKEQEMLLQRRVAAVDVVPTLHRVPHDVPGWERREKIVFLGGYQHPPNVDAMCWFVDAIWPRVKAELPGVPLVIAGSHPPDAITRLNSPENNVHVVGFVEDHRALLLGSRVGIAPLRYGAGMKGKIGEYLCCGLPCVTTSIGAEGMGFDAGLEIVIADDASTFAAEVIRLYSDRLYWEQVSQAGRRSMGRYAPETVAPKILSALKTAVQQRHPIRQLLRRGRRRASRDRQPFADCK